MKNRIMAFVLAVTLVCTELSAFLTGEAVTAEKGVQTKIQAVDNQKYLGGMSALSGNQLDILNGQASGARAGEDFVLECYRADYCMNPATGTYNDFASLGQYEIPSDLMVRLLDENSTFQNSVKAWKTANLAVSPSQIAGGMLDEKGYYEAIIFSVFMEQTGSRDFLYDIQKKAVSETNRMISQVEKWVKETDGLDAKIDIRNGKISGLSLKDKEKVQKYLSEAYENNHPALKKIGGIGSAVGTVFQTTDTIVGGVEALTSYMQLSEMSEDMKNVVMQMYNQCPSDNPVMKEALLEAATAMQNAQGGFLSAVMNQSIEITADAFGGIVDGWWQRLLSSTPYSKMFLDGAKLGMAISNVLFSTDKSIEQYEKMRCLGKFYQLLTKVNAGLGNAYKSSRTKENAGSYLASVEALYIASQLSCDFAISYADVIYKDAAVGGILLIFKQSTYEEYTSAVQGIKHVYKVSQNTFFNEYLYQLEVDYPEIYATFGEAKAQATGMHFEMDEITVGLEDAYIVFPSPVLTPEGAGMAYADYVSSDESVFEIHGPIVVCEAKKAGTVTVTATSREGGYTDTITVHVVEGKSNVVHEMQGETVIHSGTCGNNLKWELFDGGRMVISGKGAMESYGMENVENSYKIKIVSVEMGDDITSIGYMAFRNRSNLKKVSLPARLEVIEERGFEGCSNLKTVTIPESVKSIGEDAFYGCSSLEKIFIPQSVNRIEEFSFYGCNKLREVYYNGKTSDWKCINICNSTGFGKSNSNLLQATIHCSDGVITGNTTINDGGNSSVPGMSDNENNSASETADSPNASNENIQNNSNLPVTYIVTFHPNGGKKLTQKNKQVEKNQTIGALPKIIKNGYIFKGWYTQKSGGTKVTKQYLVTSNQTLYARWSKVKKPGKVKSLSVKSKKTGKLLITYKKVKNASGYELSYSTTSGFKPKNTKKTYVSSLKKEIRKLKKGKTYYVRVRAYAEDSTGKKYYGGYSAKKRIKIK
ncbi:MAG: leucine-rich repeat protein [Roseburia sp.]|nr:leucine-rich repeat protein [Roseburia sp.]